MKHQLFLWKIGVRDRPKFFPYYFILNNKPFAASPNEEIPEIVCECAKRINSKFFSVDVIERQDGCKRIVEIGDGQVSDLVGWTTERFATLWTDYKEC